MSALGGLLPIVTMASEGPLLADIDDKHTIKRNLAI
jgi:hypothetical protein